MCFFNKRKYLLNLLIKIAKCFFGDTITLRYGPNRHSVYHAKISGTLYLIMYKGMKMIWLRIK